MATYNLLGVQENFTVHQGNSISLEFELADLQNSPLDMENCLLHSQFRYAETGQVAVTLSLANGKLEWTNQGLGRWKLKLAASDTSSLRFAKDEESIDLLYDVEVTHPEYGVFKPYWGTVTVQREQTRTP